MSSTKGGDPYRARVWREAGSGGAYAEMDPDVRPAGTPEPGGDVTDDEVLFGYPEDGTVAAVLAWVDGDPFRARLALAAEQRREAGPRQTVLGPLTKLTA